MEKQIFESLKFLDTEELSVIVGGCSSSSSSSSFTHYSGYPSSEAYPYRPCGGGY